jgi:Rps23 Pro-64 3,4-dihydroxylase Tpa1-like proline 4-hydroxylase
MTTREIVNNLTETLLRDECILSARERELLANLLRRTRSSAGARDQAMAETIARAVGETVVQRAYGVLGANITEKLIEQVLTSGVNDWHTNGLPVRLGPQPPGGPQPPAPPPPAPTQPGPQPPGPSTLRARMVDLNVAVLERPEFITADSVLLDEFLAPAEVRQLMAYVQEQENDFVISEVISPGVSAGAVDYEHRRSRVLMNLGPHHEVIARRVQECLPQVLKKLKHEAFRVSQVEAQITASNHGDFFRLHSDNLHEDIVSREMTFVYFFHREPKPFQGGDLRIYDSRWQDGQYVRTGKYQTIAPEQNQIVFFPSSLVHEISPVDCPTQAFADSRFTVNGWLRR